MNGRFKSRLHDYSTGPNGATLYTEKSQTFKNDTHPFLSFVFQDDWLQNH